MITRPLDLASKLRPPPRSFDGVFFVNAGLIALFFGLFGSRFVLAPGIAVKSFELPAIVGATANARPTTHHVTVVSDKQIFAGDGFREPTELNLWLREQAKTVADPTLLIISRSDVSLAIAMRIAAAARAAGFAEVQIAATDPAGGAGALK